MLNNCVKTISYHRISQLVMYIVNMYGKNRWQSQANLLSPSLLTMLQIIFLLKVSSGELCVPQNLYWFQSILLQRSVHIVRSNFLNTHQQYTQLFYRFVWRYMSALSRYCLNENGDKDNLFIHYSRSTLPLTIFSTLQTPLFCIVYW